MTRPLVLAAAISLALAACNGQAPESKSPDQKTDAATVTPAATENPLLYLINYRIIDAAMGRVPPPGQHIGAVQDRIS